ncbi:MULTISPECIES: hypothetical protein [unclassified Lentimonas]|uniref:hypothetical protein n=1 Tax=unclassified Lentimonas TaxID=2630993 RepID=UPI0013231A8C|nr:MULTISPECIES: hypothetical protein [unclassified Lentimonas]CAA6690438.1 Unannotated [Lentimonas sp. CC19]CAA6693842.1 Unannotated [Lentimonas sp. CC10]CAA7068642.1 Unannotated [Lentimonas sp. CC11]
MMKPIAQALALIFMLPICLAHGESPLIGTPQGSQLQDYRAQEGAWVPAEIDSETPLETLIQRLDHDWELNFTGKSEYIGYTDDMFSIAKHGDAAIPVLIDYIKENHSSKARIGAVYTLHLIGIDRTVFGGFEEDFRNQAARDALLSLLNDADLQQLAARLLMRDPWPYDVPFLFAALENSQTDALPISKALFRYGLQNIPFRQKDAISNKSLLLREVPTPEGGDLVDLFRAMKTVSQGDIVIEPGLLLSWPYLPQAPTWKFGSPAQSSRSIEKILDQYVGEGRPFNYTDLGYPVDWFTDGGSIQLCSPITMKRRWLNWWKYSLHRYARPMITN